MIGFLCRIKGTVDRAKAGDAKALASSNDSNVSTSVF